MITKCANFGCREPFRYFRGGKLFIVDSRSNRPANDLDTIPPHQLEHFWLCERCSATMTLVVEAGHTPIVVSMVSQDASLLTSGLYPKPGGATPIVTAVVDCDHALPFSGTRTGGD